MVATTTRRGSGGSGGRQTSFCDRVLVDFKQQIGESDHTIESLQRKWTDLNNKCDRWTTCYERTMSRHPGIVSELAVELTQASYAGRYRDNFEHLQAWQLTRQL